MIALCCDWSVLNEAYIRFVLHLSSLFMYLFFLRVLLFRNGFDVLFFRRTCERYLVDKLKVFSACVRQENNMSDLQIAAKVYFHY